jgi:uncharacterized protein
MEIDFYTAFLLSALAAFLIGFSKSGIPNTGVLSIVLLISFLPTHFSLAVLLPLLLLGDVSALYLYRKHLSYKGLHEFLKIVLLGMCLGAFLYFLLRKGEGFKKYIGLCLLFVSSFKITSYIYPEWIDNKLNKIWRVMGFLGGVVTVISHTGGPFIALGLLLKKYTKEEFLSLYASMFFIINSLKVPLFLFSKDLTSQTLILSLLSSPFLFLGSIFGYRLIPYLSKDLFSLITSGIIFLTSIFLIIF